MKSRFMKLLFIYFIISLFSLYFNNSVFAGGSFTFKWGNDSDTGDHQVTSKHKNKKGGPSAHAPAHGYRAKHHYRYYPDRKVYQDAERGLYFYLKGDNWEVGASLPDNLKAGLGDSVSFELDTDTPYTHHEEHVKKYPPQQLKKKHKKLAKKPK